MKNRLNFKHLRELEKLPINCDHRLLLNPFSYDIYKATYNLTDDQMNAMFIVDDYPNSSQPIPS